MMEKIVFGDTNLLFTLIVCCVPITVYYLARHFVGSRLAWAVTALFLLIPVEDPSFLQYLTNAKLGYGEAIGAGFFLLGMTLLFRTQAAWGGTERNLATTGIAGAALAASMFIRPNFAIAVVWLAAAWAWTSFRRRDIVSIVALAVGLAFALWMPLHNWYYGGQFYLISKAGSSVSIPVSVHDYAAAATDIARGHAASAPVQIVSKQIRGWLTAESFLPVRALRPVAWLVHAVRLLGLAFALWLTVVSLVRRTAASDRMAVLAITALCAHIPMLFVFNPNYRYAMLGWDLSMFVLMFSIGLRVMPSPRRTTEPQFA